MTGKQSSEEEFSLEEETEDDDDDDEDFEEEEQEEEDEEEEDEDDEEEASEESDFELKKKPAKRGAANKPKAPPAKKAKASATPKATKATTPAVAVSSNSRPSTTSAKPVTKPQSKLTAASPALSSRVASNQPPESQVLEYMRNTNRPYSLLNVFENLHRVIPKPNLTRILDALVDKQELVAKTYGKSKIYCMNQDKLPVPSPQELFEIDQQIQTQQQKCDELDEQVKASETTLSALQMQLSDTDLDVKLKQLTQQVAQLEQEWALVGGKQQSQEPVSPKRKEKLVKTFIKYRSAWVARKRLAMDAINQIAEGMEKKVKEVNELCSVETDADAGVKEIPSI